MEYPSKDVIVGDHWLVLSKIGEGSFGEVFKAKDTDVNLDRFYAIKREPLEIDYPQLYHESTVYNVLAGGPGIPKCHWYGQHDGFNCIVIDLLGSSLKDLQSIVTDIPLDIVIDFGCQLISCLEHMHNRGLVYRDIKPENFLFPASCVLGDRIEMNWSSYTTENSPPPSPPSCRTVFNNWGKRPSLYAVDFGLATWWKNPKTEKPYPGCKRPIKFKTGTARYASLNVHRGRTHARRDDMESLGYLLLDLLLAGELPWSGVTARTSEAGWDLLKSIKEEMPLQDMCHGLPHGIMNFIDYTRKLRFNDQPDYNYLRELLRGCNETGPFSILVTPHPHTRMIPSPPKYQTQQQRQQQPQQQQQQQQPQPPLQQNYYQQPKKYHGHESNRRRSQSVIYRSKPPLVNNTANNMGDQQDDVFVMDDLMKELAPILPQNYQKRHVDKSNPNQNRNNYRCHSSSSQHHFKNGPQGQQPKRHHNRNSVGWNSHKNQQQQQQQQQQDQQRQWEGYRQHHSYQVKNSLQTP